MQQALQAEMRAASTNPSSAFEVSQGRRLSSSEDGLLYAFESEPEMELAPETPVQLLTRSNERYSGTLVAVHDFEVLLSLNEQPEGPLEDARVFTSPEFITQVLIERLQRSEETMPGDVALPMALLDLGRMPTAEDPEGLERARHVLEALPTPALHPNRAQAAAVARCLGSRLHFVWGPPGTGKSACLAQTVRALVEKGERVLVLAHANAAVDVAAVKIAGAFEQTRQLAEGQVLRVGQPHLAAARACREILIDTHLEAQWRDALRERRVLERRVSVLHREMRSGRAADSRKRMAAELELARQRLRGLKQALKVARDGLLGRARVLVATLSRFVLDAVLWDWAPQTVLVDEVSMAPFPAVFASSLVSAERLLLFGDFRQLPPVCVSEAKSARHWLARDAFAIAGVRASIEKGHQEPRVTMLDTQYRMAGAIAGLVSEFAYDGKLVTPPTVDTATASLALLPPFTRPIVRLDTSKLGPICFREEKPRSHSRLNPLHAAVAASLTARALASRGESVALISPYRAQARLLAALGRQFGSAASGATVHRFQGSEKDLVIFDLVDSAPAARASRLTGSDPELARRLINVALSRARGKLVIVADESFIMEAHPVRSPARRALELLEAPWRPDASELQDILGTPSIRWTSSWSELELEAAERLAGFEGRAVVSLTGDSKPAPELLDALRMRAGFGRPTVLFAPYELANRFEDCGIDLRLAPRPGGPFVLLERTFACLGGRTSAVRLQLPELVRALEPALTGRALFGPPRARSSWRT